MDMETKMKKTWSTALACNQQPPTQPTPTVGVADRCMNAGMQLPLFNNQPPSNVQASISTEGFAVERLTHNQGTCSSWYNHH